MDRRKRSKTRLIAATLFAGLMISSALAATEPLLSEMAWLDIKASKDQSLEALSTRPISGAQASRGLTESEKYGRRAFQTPTILGGQAAKAGLSCNSCHQNGRDNPIFHFPNISGAAGTADVTHGFFSSFRGNEKFDPIAIPDLTKRGKISHDKGGRQLEIFIKGLIVEEFNGPEPSERLISALADYVRGLREIDSEADIRQDRKVGTRLDMIEEAVEAVQQALEASSPDRAYIRTNMMAARHQLGLVHERYDGRKLVSDRKRIGGASAGLLHIQSKLDEGTEFRDAGRQLKHWQAGLAKLRKRLEKNSYKSLFNRKLLENSLSYTL